MHRGSLCCRTCRTPSPPPPIPGPTPPLLTCGPQALTPAPLKLFKLVHLGPPYMPFTCPGPVQTCSLCNVYYGYVMLHFNIWYAANKHRVFPKKSTTNSRPNHFTMTSLKNAGKCWKLLEMVKSHTPLPNSFYFMLQNQMLQMGQNGFSFLIFRVW